MNRRQIMKWVSAVFAIPVWGEASAAAKAIGFPIYRDDKVFLLKPAASNTGTAKLYLWGREHDIQICDLRERGKIVVTLDADGNSRVKILS